MSCTPVYLSPYRLSGILSYLEELRKFSPFYQEVLSGTMKYSASAGKPINYSTKRVKDRSNAKIGSTTTIEHDGMIYTVMMSASAIHVESSGIMAPVVSAPAGFTKSKKTTFLKAVVRTLMDDPENIFRYIPRREPAAVGIPQAPGPAVAVPDDLIERITGSPYPGPAVLAECEEWNDHQDQDKREIRHVIEEEPEPAGYDELDQGFNPESQEEIARAFESPEKPAMPEGWIPHLKLSIIEEVIPA